jgi:lipoprotein-releasing system ATP-binding protein
MSIFEKPEEEAKELVVEHVRKEYDSPAGPLLVLKDVSLVLRPGQSLAVVGPSGCGKSTLLNIIGSLDEPTSGSVRLGREQVSQLRGDVLAAFRSTSVGFVFQDHHLLPQCTALENVLLPTLALKPARDGGEHAEALLDRVGLAERLHYLPARLSGGERQRVAIARALVNGAPLLLCDEPTGNLDVETGHSIADLFIELVEQEKKMLIIVTHNLELAGRFGRCLELRGGTLQPRQ